MATGSQQGPGPAVFVVGGPIVRADIPRLAAGIGAFVKGREGTVIVCDVGGVAEPDAVAVDALARMQLVARRRRCRLRLRRASAELRELLELAGLGEVLPLCAELRIEQVGETEEREQTRGIEEEADPRDPPV